MLIKRCVSRRSLTRAFTERSRQPLENTPDDRPESGNVRKGYCTIEVGHISRSSGLAMTITQAIVNCSRQTKGQIGRHYFKKKVDMDILRQQNLGS